jgi:hypothetical protein
VKSFFENWLINGKEKRNVWGKQLPQAHTKETTWQDQEETWPKSRQA